MREAGSVVTPSVQLDAPPNDDLEGDDRIDDVWSCS